MSVASLIDRLNYWERNGVITRNLLDEISKELGEADELGNDIGTLWNRYNIHPYSGAAKFPIIRESNALANSYNVRGGSHNIDTADQNLPNRVQEYGEIAATNPVVIGHDMEEGFYRKYTNPWVVEAILALDGARQGGGPGAGDAFMGYEIGTINTLTPFPAAPSYPCIQVRLDRTNDKIMLYTCKGDGVNTGASLAVPMSGSSMLVDYQNLPLKTRLEYYPMNFDNVGGRVKLSVYDHLDQTVKSIEQTNQLKLPSTSFSYGTGFGLILCTGTNSISMQFSISNITIFIKPLDTTMQLGPFSYI